MAYIRSQKIIRNDDGRIISGSASIAESKYVKGGGKIHSRRVTIEKLGKVIWLSEDNRNGIFMSPTRGLIEYDCESGQFSQVSRDDNRLPKGFVFSTPEVHTVFGDAYILMELMHRHGIPEILKDAIPETVERSRALCHIIHGVLRDGSRIHCDDFIGKSIVSHILDDVPLYSLDTDSSFFKMMGNDNVRIAFFKSFVAHMRLTHPNFGKCTYIDSTPLPNDIAALFTNALCSHGIGATSVQTRLVFILDKETGLPVWFMSLTGNVLDMNTINDIMSDVKDNLDISIEDMVVDAGYVTKGLLMARQDNVFKSLIARMPARKGFPFKELYRKIKPHLKMGRYEFDRKGHTYFGERHEVNLFGCPINAYVYVDWMNANSRSAEWRGKHYEEYATMKPLQKDWLAVEFGFFVLISEKVMEPVALLDEYFDRTDIEVFNKTSKEYEKLLPLRKWDYTRVMGKILHDMINTIVLSMVRSDIRKVIGNDEKKLRQAMSTTKLIGGAQSLMCAKQSTGNIRVDYPSKQAKEAFKALRIPLPSNVDIALQRKKILLL